MAESKMICGMFLECDEMNRAINHLRSGGFELDAITILAPSHYGSHDFVYKLKTSIPKGALIGSLIGVAVLGLLGLLIGNGTIELIGVETTGSAFRTVFLTLAGMVAGAFVGAASGGLVGIGTPESAEKRYVFYLQEGSFILSVQVQDLKVEKHARELLEKMGAQDISVLSNKALNAAA